VVRDMRDESFIVEKQRLESEIEGFQRGDDFKTMEMRRSILERLRIRLGSIDVRCPYCSHKQKSESFKTKKCIQCNRSFEIFPKRSWSRVADTESNRRKKILILELYAILHKRRLTVF
jgi:hypothetical protein